ncbi:MAG: phytoene synthase [Psychromonas sp.]|jgi:phytoene synthase
MKKLFDEVSADCAKLVTKKYSTSFSLAVKLLSSNIRSDIYNIYGFVRFADEIVDSFHDYSKQILFNRFEQAYKDSITDGISLNPILNAFQKTVNKHTIEHSQIESFMHSMKADLAKQTYDTKKEIDAYVYGSADVVGLMCLKVFVQGDEKKYDHLKGTAMRLGSAFQKVNFLRDLKDDYELLNRSYFPNIDLKNITQVQKDLIIDEIKEDFNEAFKGIIQLPIEAKLGVYVAYKYYTRLLNKLEHIPVERLLKERIRISNTTKMVILGKSYLRFRLNMF